MRTCKRVPKDRPKRRKRIEEDIVLGACVEIALTSRTNVLHKFEAVGHYLALRGFPRPLINAELTRAAQAWRGLMDRRQVNESKKSQSPL